MFLHLTRHGQPAAWADAASDAEGLLGGDPVLTQAGVEQARGLGRYLWSLGFRGRIWSSPYRRSAQTADLAAAEVGLTFRVTPALRDIVKDETPRQHLVGATCEQLRQTYPRLDPDGPRLPYPWWETTTDDRAVFTQRLVAFVEPLLDHGGDLLLVGHGATVNQLTQVFTARAGRSDLGNWFGAWNAQLTTFEVRDDGVTLVRLADVSFLPRELVTANTARLADGHDGQTGAERFAASQPDRR